MTEPSEYKPFAAQLSNVYLTILALFCFKLFVRITLNLLTYFYIIRGNRKEAARISAEFYDYGPGQRSWADRTPLHDAAYQGRLLCLKTLIAQGHSVNALTIDHVSPLHEACVGNHVSCARALIDAGANVNVCTIDGVTPLLNSVIVGSVGCVESLLESGARPQAAAACQPSPLHEACARERSIAFLPVHTEQLDANDELDLCLVAGHSKCVDALITWGRMWTRNCLPAGLPSIPPAAQHTLCVPGSCWTQVWPHWPHWPHNAPPNLRANVQLGTAMNTPLHAAAERDCTELVQLLVEFGADANVRNMEFKRPVESAPPGSLTEGFLLLYEATPRMLTHLCRLQIRECVGRQRLHLLSTLPLPNALRNFVCLR